MADGAPDALEDALEEKRKIYERLKEVRTLVNTTADGGERARQTVRMKILQEMYREACDRCERLRPEQKKRRKGSRQTVHTGVVTWDFFERSGAVWSDLEGYTWNILGKLEEDADANDAKVLWELVARGQATLTEKQRYYIGRCFGERKTISQVAVEEGVQKSTVSRVVKSGLKRLESAVVSSLFALACIDGDTFDHLRWAAATETLTERQRECLYYLLSEDASLAMIADHLNLYKSTVSHTNTRIVGRMAAVGEGLAGMRPRRVVHRSEWRHKSEDEVAAALGISRGTYYRHICRKRPVNGIPRFAYECLARRHLEAREAAAELGCRPETVRKYWRQYADVDVSKLDTPPEYHPAPVQRQKDLDLRRLLSGAAAGEGTIGAAVDAETYRKMLAISSK